MRLPHQAIHRINANKLKLLSLIKLTYVKVHSQFKGKKDVGVDNKVSHPILFLIMYQAFARERATIRQQQTITLPNKTVRKKKVNLFTKKGL